MNAYNLIRALGLAVLLLGAGSSFAASGKEAQRSEIRKSTKEILTKLYKVQPSARKALGSASGYAVFSNFGMKLAVAGGGHGNGMVVDQSTKKETFMKMVEVQAGLGLGIKKFKLVFVFQNQQALNAFIDTGWEATAQTTAAAIGDEKGMSLQGAIAVSQGVWLYQMTNKGLALDATIKGTKYYKDDDLN